MDRLDDAARTFPDHSFDGSPSGVGTAAARRWLTALVCALLASAAGAQITIYLDFDGHSEPNYSTVGAVSVPAFTGSIAQRAEIRQRIEEDFAPFFVRVTEDEPQDMHHGYLRKTFFGPTGTGRVRVVIGGMVGDIGGTASGRAAHPLDHNVVWSVEKESSGARRSLKQIAQTASHELAHAFSLLAVDQPFAMPNIYLSHYTEPWHDLLASDRTQILGAQVGAGNRDLWWQDDRVIKGYRIGGDPSNPADLVWGWQDDVLSLTTILGIRWDDHPNALPYGTRMQSYTGPDLDRHETRVVGSGIIEINAASWPGPCPPVRPTAAPTVCPRSASQPAGSGGLHVWRAAERDVFRFDFPRFGYPTSYPPRLWIDVEPIDGRGQADKSNVDLAIEVWYRDPDVPNDPWRDITHVGHQSQSSSALWVQWQTSVAGIDPGEYAVVVSSAGQYGDLGQYEVRASGRRGLVVTPPEHVPVDWGSALVPRPTIDRFLKRVATLGNFDEAARLMAAMARDGAASVLDEEDPAPAKGQDDGQTAELMEVIRRTALMTSTAYVLGDYVDWKDLGKDAELVWEELVSSAEGLEPGKEPYSDTLD